MMETLYQKRKNEVLKNSTQTREIAKIMYNEKINKYFFEFCERKITGKPLTHKFYKWIKKDIKYYCKKYHCMDAFKKIDPNIWFLIKKFEYKYGIDKVENLKIEYLCSMCKTSNYKNIPFRIFYTLENKKHNIFDRRIANLYKNVKIQSEIQDNCDINIIKIEKCIEKKVNKNNNNKNFFKRATAIIFAALASITLWKGEELKNSDEVSKETNVISETNSGINIENSNDTKVTEVPYTSSNAIITTIITEENEIIINNDNEKNEEDKLTEDFCKENDNIESEVKNDLIKEGDKIKVISKNAKYYIDSYGTGTAYDYEKLKEEYKIKEVYAEYVTDSGVVHGMGITENNEEIHFGWFGKDVKFEHVSDKDIYDR